MQLPKPDASLRVEVVLVPMEFRPRSVGGVPSALCDVQAATGLSVCLDMSCDICPQRL